MTLNTFKRGKYNLVWWTQVAQQMICAALHSSLLTDVQSGNNIRISPHGSRKKPNHWKASHVAPYTAAF